MTSSTASNKIALITGANKGIGKEIARGLGKKGYTVLIGSRDEKNGQAVVEEFKKEDIQAHTVKLEVTDEASIQLALTFVTTKFGKLDVLVNNAGVAMGGEKPSSEDLAQVKKTYDINVFAPIRMIQVFLPLLKKSEAGRIVNVSSTLGSLTHSSDPAWAFDAVNLLSYCTSKSALNAITIQFAKELRGSPIKINSMCPGHCDTDLSGHMGPRTPTQGAAEAIRLATIGNDGPTGGFFNDEGVVAW